MISLANLEGKKETTDTCIGAKMARHGKTEYKAGASKVTHFDQCVFPRKDLELPLGVEGLCDKLVPSRFANLDSLCCQLETKKPTIISEKVAPELSIGGSDPRRIMVKKLASETLNQNG